MIEPVSAITESYGVLVGRILVDTSNWSASVLVINPDSEVVVLSPFSCMGSVVQVSAVAVAQDRSIPSEADQFGPLPPYLEDIVGGSHPSLGGGGWAALWGIIHKYIHVFLEPVTRRTQAVRHDIETNGAQPIQCGPHLLAPTGLRTEQECIKDMLEGDKSNRVIIPGHHRLCL